MALKHWLTTISLAAVMPMAMSTVLTFDEFTNGTRIDNEYLNDYGVSINGYNVDEGASNLAVIFDTTLSNTRDPDLEGPFININNPSLGSSNPNNVLIIHENPNTCSTDICSSPDDEGSRPSGFFTIDFSDPITLNSIDFFDIESSEATSKNEINLYDIFGDKIDNSFYTPGTGGNNTWDSLYFDTMDVSSIEINFNGSGAIDNIDFTVQVPAPSTILVLTLGIIGFGAARRKR
ncbi:PEP-CTERM sorting domain-containing protein [Psychromonas sp. PT13]|uniref:PEP-CTERM sorting domain-containing protein n=1 Tax=Psychromonas sp. PT13 TaxID=3439547 RepID=UPI003EBF49ED